MKVKKNLDVSMLAEEYHEFIISLNKGEHIQFMRSYVEKYKEHNLSFNNVWSLALNKVFLFKDVEALKKMFHIKFDNNILTTKDGMGRSPLVTALSVCKPDVDTTAWEILENYLKNPKSKLSKIKLEGEDLLSIRYIVELPKFEYGSVEYNFKYYTEHFLTHVYTPESISYLKSTLEPGSKFKPAAYMRYFEKQHSTHSTEIYAMKIKKNLDAFMRTEEYHEFIISLNKGEHIQFMQSYVKKYKEHNLSFNNVWSLALNKAFLFNNIDVLQKMFDIKFDNNILTTIDAMKCSPLSTALKFCKPDVDTTAWKILESYLKNPKNKLSKIKLEGKDLLNIRFIVELPMFEYGSVEYNFKYYTEHFLTHVYTPESISYLKSTLEPGSKFKPAAYMKYFEKQHLGNSTEMSNSV